MIKLIVSIFYLAITTGVTMAESIRIQNTGYWSGTNTWTEGVVPGDSDVALINRAGKIAVVATVASVGSVEVGVDEDGALIIFEGGSLTCVNPEARNGLGATGTATINSGTLTINSYWNMSLDGNADNLSLTINGGQMTVAGAFNQTNATIASAVTTIKEGILDVGTLNLSAGTLNIDGGRLIIGNDVTAVVETYVIDGRIVAYGGTGTIETSWDSTNDITIVTSVTPPPAPHEKNTFDVNQDGFDDLVHVVCENGVFTAELLTSDGNLFSKIVLTGSVTNHTAQDRWFTGDFDGNGRLDLARLWGGTNGTVYCEVETTLQDGSLDLVPWATSLGSFSASDRWFKGDFNGDGKDDLACMPYYTSPYFSATLELTVYLSTGIGFYPSSWGSFANSRVRTDLFFCDDFDGDGADDIIRVYSNNGNTACQLFSVTANRNAFLRRDWSPAGYAYNPDSRWYPGDYNGDLLMDFAVVRSENDVAKADVLLSTDSGMSVNLSWINESDIYTYGDQAWYPGDFNGDGISDLVKIYNEDGNLSADVYRSTGSDFSKTTWISKDGEYQDTADLFLTDFNGDGRDDICSVKRLNYESVIDVYRSSGTAFTRLDRTFSQLKQFRSFRGPPAIRVHKYFDPNFIIGPLPADGGDYSSVCKSGQDVYLAQGSVYERTDDATSAFTAYAHQQVFETFEAKTFKDFSWIVRAGSTQNKALLFIGGYDSVLAQNIMGDGRRYDITADDVSAGFVTGGIAHFFGGQNGSYQRFNRVYCFNSVAQSAFKIQEANAAGRTVYKQNRIQNSLVFGAGVDARGNGRNPNLNSGWADAIGMCHQGTMIRNNVVLDGTDVGIVVFTAPCSVIENNVIASISRSALGCINLLDTLYYDQWGIGGTDAYGRIQFDFSTRVQSNYLDARGSRIDIGIPVGWRAWRPETSVETNNPYGTQILNNLLDGKAFAYGIVVANGFNVTATGNVSVATHSGVGGYFAIPSRAPDPASAFAYSPDHVFNSTYGPEFNPATKPNGVDFLLFNARNGRTINSNGYKVVFYELPEAEATVEMAFHEILRRNPTESERATYQNRLMTDSTVLADDIRVELMNLPEFDTLYPDYIGEKSINGMQLHRKDIWLENLQTLDEISYNTTGNYPAAKSLYQDAQTYLTGDYLPVGDCTVEHVGGNQIRIDFEGALWTSSDLNTWQPIDPQPASPLTFIPTEQKAFFRIITK